VETTPGTVNRLVARVTLRLSRRILELNQGWSCGGEYGLVRQHRQGITNINTSKQAAEALRPLAGTLAYLLYAIGIIGVGFLAIPTLAGSAAYALAETFSWKQGLDKSFRGAHHFYTALISSMLLGLTLDS
jgi:Mn2+/Fe2+ NRAMP family transporter